MRSLFVGSEQLAKSTDLLGLADAVRDWLWDGDGKGAVFLRPLPELGVLGNRERDFISMMNVAGVEIVPVADFWPLGNADAMAHLYLSYHCQRLDDIAKWRAENFPGCRWCIDMENYDRSAWYAVESAVWDDNVLQMLAKELYESVFTGQSADFGMPHISMSPGKLSWAQHPCAKTLLGWFFRYAGKRLTGTSGPWIPLQPPQPIVNVPAWFPYSKVKVECVFASSDARTIAAGKWDFLTWPLTAPELINTEGRQVFVYIDQANDDMVTAIRQVRG